MAVTVYIPAPFRRLTDNRSYVEGHGQTVAELLEELRTRYPGLGHMLQNEAGELPAHINVYVNNQEIHSLQGKATPLKDGDEVAVIPAIAGGQLLTPEQTQRYDRQIMIPQVGPAGQRKLLDAKVLIVGAGGLGSPAAVYLAAAGVGTLGIVDNDKLDLSNLQRQILHHTPDVGRPKVESAQETIARYNPDVRVIPHGMRLTSANATDVIAQYDMVVGAVDNFATRYLLNDACYLAGKPYIDGAVFLFEGQAAVFIPGRGCYRCLFPVPPPTGVVPNPSEVGLLGALPGVIGVIEAFETLKLILGLGEPLSGRLLIFDALTMEFRQVKTRRDPHCPLCGDAPTIRELGDYEASSSSPPAAQHTNKEDAA
jgi:molybdopterin/thiamine biosynthesis adenylyltransferase/molybdopterin converting factor small subunit